jgi:hypothetical protein
MTKLYARLYTMDRHKYLPPKFSETLKDLAQYLEIEGLSEEQLKANREDNSETSSNVSFYTQSAFKNKNSNLDVIKEYKNANEEDEESPVRLSKKRDITVESPGSQEDVLPGAGLNKHNLMRLGQGTKSQIVEDSLSKNSNKNSAKMGAQKAKGGKN